jgi:hypothetical protein
MLGPSRQLVFSLAVIVGPPNTGVGFAVGGITPRVGVRVGAMVGEDIVMVGATEVEGVDVAVLARAVCAAAVETAVESLALLRLGRLQAARDCESRKHRNRAVTVLGTHFVNIYTSFSESRLDNVDSAGATIVTSYFVV